MRARPPPPSRPAGRLCGTSTWWCRLRLCSAVLAQTPRGRPLREAGPGPMNGAAETPSPDGGGVAAPGEFARAWEAAAAFGGAKLMNYPSSKIHRVVPKSSSPCVSSSGPALAPSRPPSLAQFLSVEAALDGGHVAPLLCELGRLAHPHLLLQLLLMVQTLLQALEGLLLLLLLL